MCGFSSYCHSFCGKSIASRIPQVEIFLHLHHVHVSCQNNVRMVKFSKTDQFAFSGCRKADSLFTKPCTFICIDVFLRRNGKKRYGPRQRGLNLLIGQCQCCADHGCNLCVVSACMCCPVNGISHRMRLTSDGVKFSDNSNVRSVLFHPLSANPCACKSPMYTESKATQKSRYVCGCSLLIKPWLRMTLDILRKGYDFFSMFIYSLNDFLFNMIHVS